MSTIDSAVPRATAGGGILSFARALAPHLRTRSGQTLMVIVSLLPTIALTTVQPLLLKSLIDDAILPKNMTLAGLLVLAFALILGAEALGELASRTLISRLAISITNDLRLSLFAHVQRLSMTIDQRDRTGELVSHFASDLDSVERALMIDTRETLTDVITIVIAVVILIWIEWRLALLALTLVPLVYLAQRLLGASEDDATQERQDHMARLVATVQENIAAQPVVRAFGLQPIVVRRFLGELSNVGQSTVRVGWLTGLQGMAITASGALLMTAAIGLGTVLAVRGLLTVGSLIVFFELLWWLVAAVQDFANVLLPFQYAAAGMHRIEEVLTTRAAVIDEPYAVASPPLRTAIRFEDVRFSYGGNGRPQLADLNLIIPAGKRIGVVGASGCGKSTLLSLLMRFHDPDEGRVTIDGVDVRDLQQNSWRAQIGTVFQESFLFNATIRENILLGNPQADQNAIEQAARDAEIHDFIVSLPEGYDTIVGERGGRLSGGQKQRIAIARAIVRDPTILVLDEATSSLDPQTEAAINATLERISGRRTVVAVTHRLSAITNADNIIVLDAGKIVEEGTHAQLLKRGGLYARSWSRQSGFAISEDGRRAEVEAGRLREIPLFSMLDEVTLAALANRFVTERYPPDQMVFREGDEGDKLRIVVRGTVEILKQDRQVAVLQDGDFFGEISLLLQTPRTATARTRMPTLLLSLDREQFLNLMSSEPRFREKLEEVATSRRKALDQLSIRV